MRISSCLASVRQSSNENDCRTRPILGSYLTRPHQSALLCPTIYRGPRRLAFFLLNIKTKRHLTSAVRSFCLFFRSYLVSLFASCCMPCVTCTVVLGSRVLYTRCVYSANFGAFLCCCWLGRLVFVEEAYV